MNDVNTADRTFGAADETAAAEVDVKKAPAEAGAIGGAESSVTTSSGAQLDYTPSRELPPASRTGEPDVEAIHAGLNALHAEGEVVELIALPVVEDARMQHGYFDDLRKMAQEVARLDGGRRHMVCCTLQPLKPEMRSRVTNEVSASKAGGGTSDAHVASYRHFFVDADPKREPAKSSSTDEEVAAAVAKIDEIQGWLTEKLGFPAPLRACSGNGAHAMYRIDLPTDSVSRQVFKDALIALCQLFDDPDYLSSTGKPVVRIDPANANPARLLKIYGSVARKGENTETRPHRRAVMLDPGVDVRVTREQLEALAGMKVEEDRSPKTRIRDAKFELERWMADHLPANAIVSVKSWGDGATIYRLERCPFDENHRRSFTFVTFKGGGIACKCFDHACAGKGIRDLFERYDPDRLTGRAASSGLPTVVVTGRPIRDVAAEVRQHLVEAGVPVYSRAGGVCILLRNEEGQPYLYEVTSEFARKLVDDHMDAVSLDKGGMAKSVYPPAALTDYLVLPDTGKSGMASFPPLRRVVDVPVLTADGRLLETPGYDAGSKLYYAPALKSLATPGGSAAVDVKDARDTLQELLGDFPFVSASSNANCVAMLLTPIVREVGMCPMFVVDAPDAGTGKSLLCKVMSLINTGKGPTYIHHSNDDAEMRKAVTSAFLQDSGMVGVFDNIDRPLSSPLLAELLTADHWQDRILGGNRILNVRQQATLVANGNNITIGGDMMRRIVRIRIAAGCSCPYERTGFRHPHLLAHVAENRARYLNALLSLVRSWIAAGSPSWSGKPLGSFEMWSATVGGILENAGIDGFMADRREMLEEMSESPYVLGDWLTALSREFQGRGFTAGQLLKAAKNPQAELRTLAPDEIREAFDDPKVTPQRIGNALRPFKDKCASNRYGDVTLKSRTDPKTNAQIWSVSGTGTDDLFQAA